MTDERVDDLLFEINGKLSSIEAKIDGMNETLLKHESRICRLEDRMIAVESNKTEPDSFKTELLKLMGKCLVIALTSIASLVGASGLISKLFAQ